MNQLENVGANASGVVGRFDTLEGGLEQLNGTVFTVLSS